MTTKRGAVCEGHFHKSRNRVKVITAHLSQKHRSQDSPNWRHQGWPVLRKAYRRYLERRQFSR